MSIKAGEVVGGWRVVRFVGEGRSGSVFEVRHAETGRRGALKALCGPAVRATKEDFARESDFVARQPAPGDMPAFYGCGTHDDGTPFFVMEFIEMLALDVRTGLPKKLPHRQTLRLFKGLARILIRLHANGRGHLHCDIKPENIGWRDDEPVLVDFGCARPIAEARQKPTRVGSWEYMAPEVREARCLDERADLYSLGVTLGKLCNRQSRRTFETLILHATANDPNERPQTAADFLHELKTSKDRLAKFKAVIGALIFLAAIYAAVASFSYLRRRTSIRARIGDLIDTTAIQRATETKP